VAGADALLLLCSLLDDGRLRNLLELSRSLHMEPLVEVHDEEEVQRAVAVSAHIIGVNARDLRTFAVDTDIVRRVRPLVRRGRIVVAESGITTPTDATSACAFGADAILVGEALMRADDPTAKARELATAPGGPLATFFAPARHPFVKICGLTQPEHGALVARLGADAFGLVFASVAPPHRRVTPAQAREIVVAARQHLTGLREERFDANRRLDWDLLGGGTPMAIGVFVNEHPRVVAEIAAEMGLDAVQLSGDEPPEACADIISHVRRHVLKVLRLRTSDDLTRMDTYVEAGAVPLLDTPHDGLYGGSGETGDWALAREAARRWPIILAGGLTSANVAAAIATVQPAGVDISSGVETDRAKDPVKIAAFLAAARGI
jgi:phosphoribosylanthranilate isomerase